MSEKEALDRLREKHELLLKEVGKVIVGQESVVKEVTMAILAGGHCLLVGVPGLAKTLLVNTVAKALGLSFNRIQFTPDLMPSDITGSEVLNKERKFEFVKGPLFANIVLADEINRTPPKTQAALLEAMQERNVSVNGQTYYLPSPFFVLATQNPIEQEGTYPLPEAQLDRFMFNTWVYYPSFAEELSVVKQTTGASVTEYATEDVNKYLSWGAGPRASQFLVIGAKVHAALNGKYSPDIEDVKALATPILRHRIVRNYKAEADGMTVEKIISGLL